MYTVNALKKKKTCFHFGSQDLTDEIMLPTGLPNYLIFFLQNFSLIFKNAYVHSICIHMLMLWKWRPYWKGNEILPAGLPNNFYFNSSVFFFNLEPFYLKQHPWTINNPCAFEPPKSPTPHVQVGNSGSLRWKSKGELLGNTRKLIDGQWP